MLNGSFSSKRSSRLANEKSCFRKNKPRSMESKNHLSVPESHSTTRPARECPLFGETLTAVSLAGILDTRRRFDRQSLPLRDRSCGPDKDRFVSSVHEKASRVAGQKNRARSFLTPSGRHPGLGDKAGRIALRPIGCSACVDGVCFAIKSHQPSSSLLQENRPGAEELL
jgi:hypothetical protein